MPRVGAQELTYVPASRRWKKRHAGKSYYYPSLRDETNPQSYNRCLNLWHRQRGQIAAEEKTAVDLAAKVASQEAELETVRARLVQVESIVSRQDGRPLVLYENDGLGKIRNRKGLGFRALRKAAGNAVRQHAGQDTADYFLGHVARTIGQRHYFEPPQAALDSALAWLGAQLGQTNS